jgi:hypothetical protein
VIRSAPSNLRSLDARIRNLARQRGLPENRVRRLIGIVVIGQLLKQTGAAVVKGASNIEVRIGTTGSRVSSDVDAVRYQAQAQGLDVLERLDEAVAWANQLIADVDTVAGPRAQPDMVESGA